MKYSGFLLLGTLVFGSAGAFARNPVGETADYQLDRNSARTSSMIKSGTMDAKVIRELPDATDGPAFETAVSYDFEIQFMGNQSGTELVAVAEEFFTEEFLQQLRTNGTYESSEFKIRHEGYADARNLDGKFYPRCDKLLFYDINTSKMERLSASAPVVHMIVQLFNAAADAYRIDPNASIEDLKIRAHIFVGIPVLGAAKIDMSGKYSGVNIKAGADYISP